MLTHSWSLVYFNSAGYMKTPKTPPAGFAPPAPHRPRSRGRLSPLRSGAARPWRAVAGLLLSLVERHRDNRRSRAATPNVYFEFCPWHRSFDWHIRHPDCFLQKRRLCSARHGAGALAINVHVVAVPPNGSIEHLEPNQLSPRRAGLLVLQHVEAEKLLLLPTDDPPEIRLDNRRRLVHVVSVETHRRFETEGVACAEARRNHTGCLAGCQDRRPHTISRRRRHEHFESVFACVSGA